ncbi:MAG: 16S rRNA (guanine(527)-N(7))-methyltransferase RsmG [Clostridia bacterium]|nr:16S rRNA (guanine(527)-N(7))-methyltransferase RsmG [Clostridia bacterium]
MIDQDLLRAYAADLGVALSDAQLVQFDRYAELLCEWNEKMNLTGITDPYGIVIRHFTDSLTLCQYVKEGATLIDVGTGAGFPAIPVAIARPDVTVTLLDSLKKRLTFLDAVVEALSLPCVTVHARAEDGGHSPDLRERFDVATARAVAALPTLCEYCVPFVKKGGVFVALKGPEVTEQLADAKRAAKVLGAAFRADDAMQIPVNPKADEEVFSRRLVVFEKTAPTPKAYPRPAAKIAKKPL